MPVSLHITNQETGFSRAQFRLSLQAASSCPLIAPYFRYATHSKTQKIGRLNRNCTSASVPLYPRENFSVVIAVNSVHIDIANVLLTGLCEQSHGSIVLPLRWSASGQRSRCTTKLLPSLVLSTAGTMKIGTINESLETESHILQ
jgi:hypothetical protein